MKIIQYITLWGLTIAWLTGSLSAQSSTMNYILTKSPQSAGYKTKTQVDNLGKSIEVRQKITYIDGLGRPIQEIDIMGSPGEEDIIQPIEYDNRGRKTKSYLPYSIDRSYYGLGGYDNNWQTNQEDFYNDPASTIPIDNVPYGYTRYDNSSLSKISRKYGVGEDWNPGGNGTGGHYVAYAYRTNGANEVERWHYSPERPRYSNYYPAGKLFVTQTTDEDGNISREYSDIQGNVVAKRVFDGTRWLETFYVYHNNFLMYIIPPKAVSILKNYTYPVMYHYPEHITEDTYVSNTSHTNYIVLGDATLFLDEPFQFIASTGGFEFTVKTTSMLEVEADPGLDLCYVYKYDDLGRMIEKKLPGAKPVLMVYDVLDRLVAVQDGNKRHDLTINDDNEWLVTKYDILDRPVLTAIIPFTGTRESLQNIVNRYKTSSSLHVYADETRSSTCYYRISGGLGYTSINNSTIITATYYDKYYNLGVPLDHQIITNHIPAKYCGFDNSYSNRTTGLVTQRKVKDLGTNTFYCSANYYDENGQLIRTVSEHQLNGYTVTCTKYDFNGTIISSAERQVTDFSDYTVFQANTYDHAGRQIKTEQCISYNGKLSESLVSEMVYDELGRLTEKRLGGTAGNPLQNVDYSYNIRGWLESINGIASMNSNDYNTDLFSMGLNYNNLNGLGIMNDNQPYYNGNIAIMTWNNSPKDGIATEKAYGFNYDKVNRLTSAYYSEGGSKHVPINSYSVPKIMYDVNGNITQLERYGSDNKKSIDNLKYKYIDGGNKLLSVYDYANKTWGYSSINTATEYTYDANGNLISDVNKMINEISYNHLNLPSTINLGGETIRYNYDADGTKRTHISRSGLKTDYINGFVYEDSLLKYIRHPEGKINVHVYLYEYEYSIKDLLGSTRVTFSERATGINIKQINSYYPFGMRHEPVSLDDATQKYLYNGKQLQPSTEWLDFGKRFYDPQIARFPSLDPIAEKFAHVSPYNYAENRPINGIDLWGLQYLNANEARIIIRSGEAHVNVDNFNRYTKNLWMNKARNTSNWANKSIGLETRVAKYSMPELPRRHKPVSFKGGDPIYNPTMIALQGGEYGVYHQPNALKTIGGPSPKARVGTSAMLAVNAIGYGLELAAISQLSGDNKLIQEHRDLLESKVFDDLQEAIAKGIITDEYINTNDLTDIANVVLSGVTTSENEEIYNIGVKILKEISKNYKVPKEEVTNENYQDGDNTNVYRSTLMPVIQ